MVEAPPTVPKRALRGVWTAIAVTCVLASFPLIVNDHIGFWEGDVVGHSFRSFFNIFRFYPAIAAIVVYALIVLHRIEKGEEYKEDLYVYGALAGLISLVLAALSFPPVWERVKTLFE
jgi:hypothetical protein